MSNPQGSKTTEIECEGGSAASCQTPTNDQGPDNHEAPVEKIPVRAEQPNDAYLVKMPSEIILSITEHMDRQSLRSLALTSSRLHHTVCDEFYRSFNYETFRLALKTGDFAQIQRCIAHNAAPADVTWGKEHEEPARPAHRNRRDLLHYFDHKPINYLDFAFQEGKMTADQCLFLLRWLLKNGGDIATTWADFDDMYPTSIGELARFNGKMNHIPHYFLIALLKETDRTKLEGAASIICYLSDQGFNFPREIPVFEFKLPRGSRSREDYLEFVPLEPSNNDSPMMGMMGSARPPSVLEAFLKQLRRQGATLTSPLEKCPESFRYFQNHRCVLQLYDDLLDPLKWRPIYDGEVGDIWEAKLNLLDRYQGMDDYERPYLVSILASVRKVEDKIRAQGVSVVRRNARACWLELMETLPSRKEKSEIPMDSFHDVCTTDRVHRFTLEYRINAGKWWDKFGSSSPNPLRSEPDPWVEQDWLDGN
ncbi:hypothetical protein MRS44_000195 [Fusarium solani]|uniref:uncharacterized protein n=1 Tax=Fusarium solani TaxID=169388 RepID=UPI0032C4A50E|nr:hypothetical protein MRS44_000195 [Fusarium solani]